MHTSHPDGSFVHEESTPNPVVWRQNEARAWLLEQAADVMRADQHTRADLIASHALDSFAVTEQRFRTVCREVLDLNAYDTALATLVVLERANEMNPERRPQLSNLGMLADPTPLERGAEPVEAT